MPLLKYLLLMDAEFIPAATITRTCPIRRFRPPILTDPPLPPVVLYLQVFYHQLGEVHAIVEHLIH